MEAIRSFDPRAATGTLRWRRPRALIAALAHLQALNNVQRAWRQEATAAESAKKSEISGVVSESRDEEVEVPAIRAVHSIPGLNMEAGQIISTSRDGAKPLRNRVL